MKITVAGLGPGNKEYILPVVQKALALADVVIGYDYYFQFGKDHFKCYGCICIRIKSRYLGDN